MEVELRKRITYSDYIITDNPLPFYDGIPGLLYISKLRSKITYEENGQANIYHIDHVFLSNSLVSQRTLRGPAGNEVTKYEYY